MNWNILAKRTYVQKYKCRIYLVVHRQHIHFYISTRPKYSFSSLTSPFLHDNSTKTFFRIHDTSISMYQLDQNIFLNPQHLNFYVTTLPKYSVAYVTPPFLCINSTKIFFCILNNSLSTYQLDRNILSHPWHLHLYVSTRPKYSFASLTSPFIHVHWAKIFFRIRDTSISLYQLDQKNLLHPQHLNIYVSTHLLSHPWHLHFYVSSRPRFFPWHLLFNVATWPKYLFASSKLHFNVSTPPKYSFAPLTPPFLCI